jgi:hypothetical protein
MQHATSMSAGMFKLSIAALHQRSAQTLLHASEAAFNRLHIRFAVDEKHAQGN